MRRLSLLLFLWLLSLTSLVSAHVDMQPHQQYHAKLSMVNSTKKDNTFTIKLDIDKGWKIYTNQVLDIGRPMQISLNDSAENIAVQWPKGLQQEIDGFRVEIYQDTVKIPLKILHADPINNNLLKVEYIACGEYCSQEVQYLPLNIQNHDTKLISWQMALFFAFLGGLILNIMPCVLPVIALKLLGIVKYSKLKKMQIRLHLLASSAGIIFSFLLLAVINIVLQRLGNEVGWGMHFQNPSFIIFMIFILIIFASNLNGDFEIHLNNTFAAKLVTNNTFGYVPSFFTGVFATLLATPCTAPFLSVAVAYALSQDWYITIIQYLFIGIGMAFPFLLSAIFPQAIKLLPKPGKWMLRIKKLFALLLVITATWLFYILYFQIDIEALMIIIGGVILIKAVLTNEKFLMRTIMQKGVWIILISIITYSIAMQINVRQLNTQMFIEKSWEIFSEEKLEEYLAANNIVFVDVTAEWCLICKLNKLRVLDSNEMLSFFEQHGVKKLRANYTNFSPTVKELLDKHGLHGVPVSIIYGPNNLDGIILPEVLKVKDVKNAVKQAGE